MYVVCFAQRLSRVLYRQAADTVWKAVKLATKLVWKVKDSIWKLASKLRRRRRRRDSEERKEEDPFLPVSQLLKVHNLFSVLCLCLLCNSKGFRVCVFNAVCTVYSTSKEATYKYNQSNI